jgi:histidyl-tRNA synthetase
MNSPRGTHVLFDREALAFEQVSGIFQETAQSFGFTPISTPIFEFSPVFSRSLGETSDIVSKEMYSFQDRNQESFTLRPEGTAGIARAYAHDGLSQHSPFKVYYQGPMFRYERPQKGRNRQFHQLGVENIGAAVIFSDLEVIDLGHQFLTRLGLMKECQLLINSIGDEASRKSFREKFVSYLSPYEAELSEDSKKRLHTNPLRIFDSKSEADQKILEGAPSLEEALNDESRRIRDQIFNGLERLGIPYTPSSHLVRGLDYYTHVVFEFVTTQLGAQGTVLAGGRYDHLIENMGGPKAPGVGFAAGMERLVLLKNEELRLAKDVMVIPIHQDLEMDAFVLAENLRKQGLRVFTHFSGNLSKRMKKAHSQGVKWVVILGPEELKKQVFQVKDLASGDQFEVSQKELSTFLRGKIMDSKDRRP